jgi:phytoene synthase
MDPLVEHSLRTIEQGSKSFATASRLFDRRTREGAILLYAWCRHCDDQIDDQVLGFTAGRITAEPAEARLARLERDTRRALAGDRVDQPAFAALREVVRRHEIPHHHPLELLQGFAMDVAGTSYETLEDSCRYCYHVAGVVGVMMAYVMGARGEDTLDRASDLGIAFQMTNIARDVIPDAGAQRVYLPAAWLRAAGVPVTEVERTSHREAVAIVAARLLDEAERYYASAMAGIARLPFRSAWAIAAARRIYQDIGRLVRRRGVHAWDERISTSRARKALLLLAAAGDAARPQAARSRHGLWTRPRS